MYFSSRFFSTTYQASNYFFAAVIMSHKVYIAQTFQNGSCILNMTWNACCPMCCIVYYHSPFIRWLLNNKASTKSVCPAICPSLHPKHRTKLNSLCNFQLWFMVSVLLKWENKQPFRKGWENKQIPSTNKRERVRCCFSFWCSTLCNRHCI